MANIRETVREIVDIVLEPKYSPGISGFVFDVPTNENISYTADITDHYTENNSHINDHITIKPIKISLSGLIGELVYRQPEGVAAVVKDLQSRLSIVQGYAGQFTPPGFQEVQQGINIVDSAVSTVNQSIERIKNTIAWIQSVRGKRDTLQQQAAEQLKSLMYTKELITVQTPWGYFDNMVIDSVSITQNEDSKLYSDITVTVKEIRFAEVEFTTFDENLFPQREEMQKQEEADQGQIKGERNSFIFDVADAAGAVQ
jgi:hypothetical protein